MKRLSDGSTVKPKRTRTKTATKPEPEHGSVILKAVRCRLPYLSRRARRMLGSRPTLPLPPLTGESHYCAGCVAWLTLNGDGSITTSPDALFLCPVRDKDEFFSPENKS